MRRKLSAARRMSRRLLVRPPLLFGHVQEGLHLGPGHVRGPPPQGRDLRQEPGGPGLPLVGGDDPLVEEVGEELRALGDREAVHLLRGVGGEPAHHADALPVAARDVPDRLDLAVAARHGFRGLRVGAAADEEVEDPVLRRPLAGGHRGPQEGGECRDLAAERPEGPLVDEALEAGEAARVDELVDELGVAAVEAEEEDPVLREVGTLREGRGHGGVARARVRRGGGRGRGPRRRGGGRVRLRAAGEEPRGEEQKGRGGGREAHPPSIAAPASAEGEDHRRSGFFLTQSTTASRTRIPESSAPGSAPGR